MNSLVSNYQAPGIVFSIISLSLVTPVLFMFRHYFRSLDFMQMSYLFALTMYSKCFSSNLDLSFTSFNYNLFSFCTKGDLVCTLGFQLSFGSILIGFLLLIAIFIGLQRCGKKDLQFQPLYLTFKGFFKWFYLPCTYYSVYFLTSAVNSTLNQGNLDGTKLISAASIGSFCLLFPFWQLIFYKCIQTQETPIWRKWLQFFGYIRLLVTGTLLGLYAYYQSVIYLDCIMITLILYPFIYVWKGQFRYPILERIIFVLGEVAFLGNFFIFKFRTELIQYYDLDFFLIAFILLIDVTFYFIRACCVFIYGIDQKAVIHPLMPNEDSKRKTQKMNRYDHDSVTNVQYHGETQNDLSVAKQPSVYTKRSKK